MIAVRVADELRLVVIASRAYLEGHGRPKTSHDRLSRNCIRVRLPSVGLLPWRFAFERGDYDGVTYLDMYFLKRSGADDESLHFHEMIHVVQWRLLGAEFFLAMYAGGLEKFGYRNSPLEKMAYDAQEVFSPLGPVFNAEKLVEKKLSEL
jgi:hypothetical protein